MGPSTQPPTTTTGLTFPIPRTSRRAAPVQGCLATCPSEARTLRRRRKATASTAAALGLWLLADKQLLPDAG